MSRPSRLRPAVDLDAQRGDGDAIAREVDNEIAFHLELRIEQLMARGMTRDAARHEALRQFGPLDEARAVLASTATTRDRHMRFTERFETIRDDVAYSLRQLRRAPGFSAAAIITLGLGIGANATMFGAIDRLLLRAPLHVVDPARLATASVTFTARDGVQTQTVLSHPIYEDLRRTTDAFQYVAAYRAATIDYGNEGAIRPLSAIVTTSDYFRALGVRPMIGRFFTDEEAGGEVVGAAVFVASYSFWQRELGGDVAAIGRTIQVSGRPHTVIGVAPDGFSGLGLGAIDAWIPLTDGLNAETLAMFAKGRQNYSEQVVARLRDGVSLERAEQMASASVVTGAKSAGATDVQLRARVPRVVLTSALPREARRDQPEAKVSLLLGAVSLFVLLLACANVMNLQLARSIRRRREIAVRLALGVSRGRLLRQLVLDCLLLGLAGGVAGLLIAGASGSVMRTMLFPSARNASVVDGRVLLFAFVVAIIAGLLAGLVPALEMLRTSLVNSLKEGGRGGESRQSGRLRVGLLVAQATLTTVLLVGTGLFVLSLKRIEAVPLGFEVDHVGVARLNTDGRRVAQLPSENVTERERLLQTFARLEETARQTPGVEAAALALTSPFQGSYAVGMSLPGRDSVPVTRDGGPYYNGVTPDFFKVLGIRFLAGRAFTQNDRGTPPVLIVNETAARLWWPNESAIGKCVNFGDDTPGCSQVVGVVQNTHRRKIIEDDFVQIFVPMEQAKPLTPGVVLFRTTGDLIRTMPAVHRRMQSAEAGLPLISTWTLDQLIAPQRRSWRLGATMFGIFGVLALVLAAIGLYSVLAYDVAHRRHELGIRTALGAARSDLAGLIVGRGLRTVAIGAAIGFVISLGAAPIVESLLFQTSAHDPSVFAAIAVVLAIVSGLATGVPALRAARVDPSIALRSD